MNVQTFSDKALFIGAAKNLLIEALTTENPSPAGIMLSGGKTPIEVFRRIEESGITARHEIHVLFSDERMVPCDSPDSNYANAQPMIAALAIPENRVIRVRTELPIAQAAQTYHDELETFFHTGGHVVLGLLGLGADGHTASLFSLDQIREAGERWAMPVPNKGGFDRVSVTPKLLRRIERIVFLVSGPEKAAIVRKLQETPEEVPAAQAVAGSPHVELWYCQ